uniref:Uncharacterized protein n=1 Tax=Oryza sativa subsp. japonica TaxID=39947 RepID=Q6H5D4_ORYSJ|nr:hypothetical protein [Oryza sativa Japonica Group]
MRAITSAPLSAPSPASPASRPSLSCAMPGLALAPLIPSRPICLSADGGRPSRGPCGRPRGTTWRTILGPVDLVHGGPPPLGRCQVGPTSQRPSLSLESLSSGARMSVPPAPPLMTLSSKNHN